MPLVCKSQFLPHFTVLSSWDLGQIQEIWRKRVGVEPTIRTAKDRIAGFEDREGHRTPFASVPTVSPFPKHLVNVTLRSELVHWLGC